jgi:hypothetical protein
VSSRLPVRQIDWVVVRLQLDPIWLRQMEAFEAKVAAVQRGELSWEEAFGPPMSVDDIRAMLDRPGSAMHYPLPKHWHWMGPRDRVGRP